MVPGRLLFLFNDRSLQVELERALQRCASIVVPDHKHTIEECIRDGKYYGILMSYDFAHRYQSQLLSLIDRSVVPIERVLMYKHSEWEHVSPLIERGIVTRLVPDFWDVQSLVEYLRQLCEREEFDHAIYRHNTSGLADGDLSDLRKRTLELEMQNRRLLALATTDGLTGLANRRELNDVLNREINRSRRFTQPLSFVMCDVDFFKQYNDNFGHPAGDDVLQSIAAILRSRIRASDMAARYGGEEFGIVLPMTTKEQAVKVADTLRQRIADHRFPHQESQPNGNLTISMGVATLGEDGVTAAEIIENADRALYRAKQTGRNKVVAYEK